MPPPRRTFEEELADLRRACSEFMVQFRADLRANWPAGLIVLVAVEIVLLALGLFWGFWGWS